jgi:hypothetical protein
MPLRYTLPCQIPLLTLKKSEIFSNIGVPIRNLFSRENVFARLSKVCRTVGKGDGTPGAWLFACSQVGFCYHPATKPARITAYDAALGEA